MSGEAAYSAAVRASIQSNASESDERDKRMARLSNHVELYNYDIASQVPYDGDCFFHSISFLLGKSESESSNLRKQLCTFIESKVCRPIVVYFRSEPF